MDTVDLSIWGFVSASALMAIGIGTDVAIATLTQAAKLKTIRLALLWVIGVSLTHTLFPMAGYLLTYFSIQLHPIITPIVGLIAAMLIFNYLKSELHSFQPTIRLEQRSTTSPNPEKSNQTQGSRRLQETKQLWATLGLILAVSWDALWSGPAKSAQVVGWPDWWVWGSFYIVGAVITIATLVALFAGYRLAMLLSSNQRLWLFGAAWLQFGVIGYFGLLAFFTYTLNMILPWWLLLQLSFSMVLVVLLIKSSKTKIAVNA